MVVSPTRIVTLDDGDVSNEAMYKLHRQNFSQWDFHSRWEIGQAEYREQVEVRAIFSQTFCINCSALMSPRRIGVWDHVFEDDRRRCSRPEPGTGIPLENLVRLGYKGAYAAARELHGE